MSGEDGTRKLAFSMKLCINTIEAQVLLGILLMPLLQFSLQLTHPSNIHKYNAMLNYCSLFHNYVIKWTLDKRKYAIKTRTERPKRRHLQLWTDKIIYWVSWLLRI